MLASPLDDPLLTRFRRAVDEAYGEARAIMNAVIEGDVRRDIGGDQQRVGRIETDVAALTFKHVLLPIWVAAYRYRGRDFVGRRSHCDVYFRR